MLFFFFKQKTAYEMRISDWSSDVCSSDLKRIPRDGGGERRRSTHAVGGQYHRSRCSGYHDARRGWSQPLPTYSRTWRFASHPSYREVGRDGSYSRAGNGGRRLCAEALFSPRTG